MNKKITTIDEWQELLANFKSNHGRCETNCYLSEHTLSEYINCGRIFYTICEDTLWLFEVEKGYVITYYFVVKDKAITCTKNKDKQVVYLVGSEDRYKAEKRENELINGGFVKYRKNIEYIYTVDVLDRLTEADEKCSRFIKKLGIHYDWMTSDDDYDELFSLWNDRIDEYSVKYALPSKIKRLSENRECMVAKKEDGEIVAACQYEISNNRGFSENVAVLDQYNGAGIGAALSYHSILYILQHAADDTVYVWENNLESRRLTEKFGKKTGRFSQQLIL